MMKWRIEDKIEGIRYAIIIGINDYVDSPLKYCVNDADEIKHALIKYARYSEDNIYIIISDDDKSIRDITGKYYEAIESIGGKFRANIDSMFFYFAGHGSSVNNESRIKFQDSAMSILRIFRDVDQFEPKIQLYVIDACQSGGKVLTRGEDESLVKKYLENSSGTMLLYACQSFESAKEEETKQHGIMTHCFLQALYKTELYDENGILSLNKIQDYVSKETSKITGFVQNPVIESRLTGYCPFAFSTAQSDKNKQIINRDIVISGIRLEQSSLDYSYENRVNLQDNLIVIVKKRIADVVTEEDVDYIVSEYDDINMLPLSNRNELVNRIVSSAENNNWEPINDVLLTMKTKNPNYRPRNKIVHSMMLAGLGYFDEEAEPQYFFERRIDSANAYWKSYFKFFISTNIRKVSFGVACVVYQAKWGLVVSRMYFAIEWDGESDRIANDINIVDLPFFLDNNAEKHILEIPNEELFEGIREKIQEWNKNRNNDLSEFVDKASKILQN